MSNLDYCVCDTGPAPDFYHASRPVARKQHQCSECGCAVRPGERYERVWAKWEGKTGVIVTCLDCLELRDALSTHPCFCWLHHSLLDDAIDYISNLYSHPAEQFGYWRLMSNHRARRRYKERRQ